MKKTLVFALIGLLPAALQAQVGIGTATPHPSAQLEISAVNKGLLIPRVTYVNRPASPATGLLIYQTDNTPGYYFYDGSSWQALVGTATPAWNLTGNAGNTTSNFLGTTDNQSLVFKVNNEPAGLIDYTATQSTFYGFRAGASNIPGTGLSNTAIGYKALQNNTAGYSNIALGGYALSSNTTGNSNHAFGYYALSGNTTGTENVAQGIYSLVNNTTGSFNVAVGSSSLTTNTTGSFNTAVGEQALFVSTGDNNTALGCSALSGVTTGNYNTGVGRYALTGTATGSNNTAIGYNAYISGSAYSNSTALGSNAVATASNMVRIGNGAVTTIGGAVGWSVLSDVRFKTDIQPQVHGLDFIMRLEPIVYHIDVRKLNHFLLGDAADSLYGDAQAESIRKKESIRYSGFSAQQVEEAAAAVQYDFSGLHKPEGERDHYSLEYAEFVVPLTKAVQEQQQLIEQLKESNGQLKKEIMEYRKQQEAMLRLLRRRGSRR
jgi:hypothetical protein